VSDSEPQLKWHLLNEAEEQQATAEISNGTKTKARNARLVRGLKVAEKRPSWHALSSQQKAKTERAI
jgi:hypothetical protein